MATNDDVPKSGWSFLIPGAMAALYVALAPPQSAESKWEGVVVIFFVLPMASMLAAGFAAYAAEWLLDKDRSQMHLKAPSELSPHAMLAGMLLFTACWIFWQSDRRSRANALARCVAENLDVAAPLHADSLVLSCANGEFDDPGQLDEDQP